MKAKKILCAIFIVNVLFLTTFILYNSKTYSFGILKQVEEQNGKKVIIYKDTETDSNISFEDALKYFGIPIYEEMYYNDTVYYFERGIETNYQTFIKGQEKEKADNLAALYGSDAYRVHTTSEFIHALDDIYQNLKIGEFHIIFSRYEAIDFNEVDAYYKKHYGVEDIKENYYTYLRKGKWEPNHFGLHIENAINNGELILSTTNIRVSGNEEIVVEEFTNKILPYLNGSGSDYDKILNTYTYIRNTTSYQNDNTIDDMLSSYSSTYDTLITRKSTCIGYSIAFSYIMDKMGIESYIVDHITEANEVTQAFSSVHTYNIVKLNNKFYKIDLTGGVFLDGITAKELYDSKLDVSNTRYQGNTNTNIDYNSINSILSSSKTIKTTTTTKKIATTTNKTYAYSVPGGEKKTTNNEVRDNKTEETRKTTIISKEDSNGNIITIPVEVNDSGEIITTPSGEYQTRTTTTEKIEEKEIKKKKKLEINYNYILFPLLAIGILTLIVLKLKDKSKISINNNKSQEILNRDIIKKEDK